MASVSSSVIERRHASLSFLYQAAKSLLLSCAALLVLLFTSVLASTNSYAQSANQVGFWWKPTESGWGLSIQQQGARTFAIWFTYGDQSVPIWHTMDCAFTGTVCAGDLTSGTGLPFAQITGGANPVIAKSGTASLTLTSANRMNLSYTVGTVTQTKSDLEPLNFGSSVPICSLQAGSRATASNYTDLWWGGAAASGWGVQISHQGNQIFFGWYAYDDQGNASWLTGLGTQDATNPARFSGSVSKVNTGVPFSQINGPNPTAATSIGTFSMNFTNGENGSFTYTIPGAANRTLNLTRFAIVGGNTNLCVIGGGGTSAKAAEASRFLAQATFGPRMAEIDALAASTPDAWINEQFVKPQTLHLPPTSAYLSTLAPDNRRGQTGFLWAMWRNFSSGEDQLRQRVAFALSEMFVISLSSSLATAYPYGPAQYLDTLGANAFGNYRKLLDDVTYSPMMGNYLTHIRNRKENVLTGAVPDENYAREVMQLMSIGLYQLNLDGTQKLDGAGKPIDTYSNADISGLAKVFTGLSWAGPDTSDTRFRGGGGSADVPDHQIKPMQAYDQFHSTSQKQFLGVTIPATTVAATNADIKIALDTLFNHPNVGPFFGKQLIQRLVTANPSPAYVSRVASAFNNNGAGVRGDMKAVIKAVLLDPEARTANVSNTSGKLREPVVRFVHWMRSFNTRSQNGQYLFGSTSDPSTALAQSPMNAPSVFNFFRPGFIPPNSKMGAQGLVSPEAQITSETSVAGYLNFMRTTIERGVGATQTNGTRDIIPDYTQEIALANDADKLIDRVALLLAAGNLSANTRTQIRTAINSVAIRTAATDADADRRNRVYLAIYLTMASPDYILQN
jgi:uncharacterized protein (DUF1800 family)